MSIKETQQDVKWPPAEFLYEIEILLILKQRIIDIFILSKNEVCLS